MVQNEPQRPPVAVAGVSYWQGFAPGRYYPLFAAVRVTVHQAGRPYRYTGVITLADPDTGDVLGQFQFATGGAGRGSAPFADYEVGSYREDGPIGKRWMLRERGRDDGDVWDSKIGDRRDGIELHAAHTSPGFSLGCIAVAGDWRAFMAIMNRLRDRLGLVIFSVGHR